MSEPDWIKLLVKFKGRCQSTVKTQFRLANMLYGQNHQNKSSIWIVRSMTTRRPRRKKWRNIQNYNYSVFCAKLLKIYLFLY